VLPKHQKANEIPLAWKENIRSKEIDGLEVDDIALQITVGAHLAAAADLKLLFADKRCNQNEIDNI
jgi:hypothetical protein